MTLADMTALLSALTPADLAIAAITAILGVILAIALLNALAFPRLRRAPADAPLHDPDAPGTDRDPTLVSVCIPARDEAPIIADTIARLLAQDHPAFEIVLLDDGSSDGTAAIARRAAGRDPRVRIIEGRPLPPGWIGKNWACHQLSGVAQGKLLCFTDADVAWGDGALRALTATLIHRDADMVTVWSTQVTVTWGERLIVPLIAFVILGYLPTPLVHHTRSTAFAAANGQCLLFRRRAYDRIGGHMAVRASIVEDIAFARAIKRRGARLRMIDGAGMIACRMYDSWAAVRRGFAKNIIAGYGGLFPFVLGVLFHWAILLVPWALLFAGYSAALIPIVLGVLVRAVTALATRQRPLDALLLPLSALAMTAIAAQAVLWRLTGGARWKGRIASV
ncbi:MAG: glycosyltransferase family 2 protein [Chloroflexota bacterium]|nr:glycosyltransferase family 2 protein [Chloroflexota bacterium]